MNLSPSGGRPLFGYPGRHGLKFRKLPSGPRAGDRFFTDLIRDHVSEERIMAAYQAFRREINLEGEKKRRKRKVK